MHVGHLCRAGVGSSSVCPRGGAVLCAPPPPHRCQGIHCRFGMTSIIAESHFDGGRNFIAMVRGKKRYVLNAPDQCRWVSGVKS